MASKKKIGKIIKYGASAVLSSVSGMINGLFGAGGGLLVVPTLSNVMGVDVRQSHATAIVVVLPLCVISSVIYTTKGIFNVKLGIMSSILVTIGGVFGALLLSKTNRTLTSLIFYLLLIIAGFKMIF